MRVNVDVNLPTSDPGPINGFQPFMVMGLTNEQDPNNTTDGGIDFFGDKSASPGGSSLPLGQSPLYTVALVDTGSSSDILSYDDSQLYDPIGDFDSFNQVPIAGISGTESVDISKGIGVYATSFANAGVSNGAITVTPGSLRGQYSVPVLYGNPGDGLPTDMGTPILSQYRVSMLNSQPVHLSVGSTTYRSPSVSLANFPASGGVPTGYSKLALTAINQNAFAPGGSETSTAPYFIGNFIAADDGPQDPLSPGAWAALETPDGTVGMTRGGTNYSGNSAFLIDTGSQISILSNTTASQVGIFNASLQSAEFIVDAEGVGGITQLPGYFLDSLTLTTQGGPVTVHHVPVVVVDLPNPDGTNTPLPGLLGSQVFQDRDLIFNTDVSTSSQCFMAIGPQLSWKTNASGNWTNSANWPTVVNAGGTSQSYVPNGIDMQANFERQDVVTSPVTVTVNALVTVGSIYFDNTNRYTIAGTNAITLSVSADQALITVATGSHTISAPLVLASETFATVWPSTSTLTISGNISSSGTHGLTKYGDGTLLLSGANTYTGNSTINAGTLVLGNASALGNGGALAVNGGTLDFNGVGAVSTGSLSGTAFVSSANITDTAAGAGTSTLSVTQSAAGIYNGTINNGATRTVALTKGGASTLTVTNPASTFSGGTTVSAGKLISTVGTTLGAGPVTLTGGTLSLAGLTTTSGFGGAGTGWTTHDVGSYTTSAITANVLKLTDGANNQARTAWFNTPQNITNANGFAASFVYTPSGNKAANGVTFVIQNDPRGTGVVNGSGAGLGYTGTTNSGAVELNIVTGADGGVGTAFGSNGSIPTNQDVSPVNLAGGNPIQISLTYAGDTVTEVLTDTVTSDTSTITFDNIDLQSLLGGTTGFVGFTGSTGGSNSIQTISNFSFQNFASGTLVAGNTWSNQLVAGASATSGLEIGVASTTLSGGIAFQAGSTLNLTPSSTLLEPNSNYGVTVTAPVALSGSAALNIANNGTGAGIVTLAGITSIGSSTLTLGGAGSVTITGQIGATTSIVAKTNTTLTNVNRTFGGLSVGNGAKVTQQAAASAASPVVLHPGTFSATGSGKLDITNNELLATGAQSQALTWIGNGSNGNVITSTIGLVLGYKDAGSGNYEIRATLLGDSDLDGKVNVADLANLAGNFGVTTGKFWINGDFDYNHNVNVADLADLAGNFGKDLASAGFGSGFGSGSAAAAASSDGELAATGAVPEPAAIGLIIPWLALGLRRRRRD
jgi:autotransporter-associated beta strand protein